MKETLLYAEVISEQTTRALWSIHNVISCIPDDLWNKKYCDMPLWKHVYHTLHSLDRWYINPNRYDEPSFHVNDLNNLNEQSDMVLTRLQLEDYFRTVNTKIERFNSSLTDSALLHKPQGCRRTCFTLIMAQLRHLQYHTGMIMGFVIDDVGKWPLVAGLEQDISGSDFPYFE